MQLQFVKWFECAILWFTFFVGLTLNSIKVSCAKAGVNAGNFMLNGISCFDRATSCTGLTMTCETAGIPHRMW